MSEHGFDDSKIYDSTQEPERVEDERVVLEREVLDPSTSVQRLREILHRDAPPSEEERKIERGWLENEPLETLVELLKDRDTPSYVLEEILEIAKEREARNQLPPSDE